MTCTFEQFTDALGNPPLRPIACPHCNRRFIEARHRDQHVRDRQPTSATPVDRDTSLNGALVRLAKWDSPKLTAQRVKKRAIVNSRFDVIRDRGLMRRDVNEALEALSQEAL